MSTWSLNFRGIASRQSVFFLSMVLTWLKTHIFSQNLRTIDDWQYIWRLRQTNVVVLLVPHVCSLASNVPLWNWWLWLAGQKPSALMNIKIAGNYSWRFISPQMLEVLMILMNHRVFWQSMAKSPDVASCFLTVMPTKCLGFSLRLSCSTWTMFQWDHKTVPCKIGDLHKRRYGAMVKTIHNTFTISVSKWFCLSMTMIIYIYIKIYQNDLKWTSCGAWNPLY